MTLPVWVALAGCSNARTVAVPDCAPLADARVVDEVGLPGEYDEAVAALASFRTWTATPTVCVDEVRITAELATDDGGTPDGMYVRRDRTAYVLAGAGRVTHVVHHELCHALDDRLGLSDAHPDLFPADESGLDPELTEAKRRHETFADDCTVGPETVDWTVRFGACSGDTVEPPDPRWRVLLDEAFDGAWSHARALDLAVVPLDVDPAVLLRGPQPAEDGTLWLQAQYDGYYTYVRVDPDDGRALSVLDAPIDPQRLAVAWYGGVGDPAILTWGVGPHLAWRATLTGPAPAPYPHVAEFGAGAVIDDTLYVQTTEDIGGLKRVTLSSGAFEPEPGPAGAGALTSLTATDAGLAGAWLPDGGSRRIAVRPAGETDWRLIVPPVGKRPLHALAIDRDRAFVHMASWAWLVDFAAIVGPDGGWTIATVPCRYVPVGWAMLGDTAVAIDRDTNTLLRFSIGETP